MGRLGSWDVDATQLASFDIATLQSGEFDRDLIPDPSSAAAAAGLYTGAGAQGAWIVPLSNAARRFRTAAELAREEDERAEREHAALMEQVKKDRADRLQQELRAAQLRQLRADAAPPAPPPIEDDPSDPNAAVRRRQYELRIADLVERRLRRR